MAMWPVFSPAWATTSPPPTSRVSLAAPTRDIADAVRAEGRCLITSDLDFSDPRKFSPSQFAGIVVLRLHVPTSRLQVKSITRFLLRSRRSSASSGPLRRPERGTGPRKRQQRMSRTPAEVTCRPPTAFAKFLR